eukprot:TRINITY_DN8965_c0_g1_i9.p1 TRINITY_DN8965_c0_g1~~TRINITY_DN8965_c0_g1_i9.p1  ORF type:complete len:372 (-),score=89.97 TRINITY_DN8965_c0_g1_i9:923-1969(-)
MVSGAVNSFEVDEEQLLNPAVESDQSDVNSQTAPFQGLRRRSLFAGMLLLLTSGVAFLAMRGEGESIVTEAKSQAPSELYLDNMKGDNNNHGWQVGHLNGEFFANREQDCSMSVCTAHRLWTRKQVDARRKVVRGSTFDDCCAPALDDDTLRQAVSAWLKGGSSREDIEQKYGLIEDWDVQWVTNMKDLFKGAKDFNGDLSKWNVSRVNGEQDCSMYVCDAHQYWTRRQVDARKKVVAGKWFSDCCAEALNDETIRQAVTAWLKGGSSREDIEQKYGLIEDWDVQWVSKWDTSSVADMNYMFFWAYAFNGDVSKWDTSSVTDMTGMFDSALAFNKHERSVQVCQRLQC